MLAIVMPMMETPPAPTASLAWFFDPRTDDRSRFFPGSAKHPIPSRTSVTFPIRMAGVPGPDQPAVRYHGR
ncbi:hypothetical protein FOZ70_01495 [Burkholderia sp. COPS]|uniref:hypothetical protein n=1 Tax=Burkholderia sp. COPS TaxID=2597663 RepID=UPI001CA478CE|nr:hypothetical protein [Burkholderia sp. COPS]MBW5803426.1 hypothetical protein [Burkholderia sp. COPS]